MAVVHASCGTLKPAPPNLKSEPAIVAGIAKAILANTKVDWYVADYGCIRAAIEAVLPSFANQNDRVKVPGNFRLDIPASNRDWATPNGKANFIVFRGLDGDPRYREAGVIKLATIRSHDHYNTTIYGFNDCYRGVRGRRDVVFMNEADLAEHGRSHRDLIDVEAIPLPGEAKAGRILRKLTAVAFDIAQGSAAAYYPEANPMVALGHLGIRSGTPAYKSVLVQSRVADLSDVASPRRADLTAVGPGGRPYVPSGLE